MLTALQLLEPCPTYICVAHELHEDGSDHLHAFVQWDKKIDKRSERFFDVEGYHPNIQSARKPKECHDYVTKDNDFVTFGVPPSFTSTTMVNYEEIIASCSTQEEFLKKIREANPKDYIFQYERLLFFARHHFKTVVAPYVSPYDDFPNVPDAVQQWESDEFLGSHPRKKTLVLEGPSRIGKTAWARALGRHMYFNGCANFKDDWDDEAQYIIFDDFEWQFIPNKKGFFGCQETFQITGKYMPIRTVQWGKPCIVLTNKPLAIPHEDIEWYRANCVFINVKDSFY